MPDIKDTAWFQADLAAHSTYKRYLDQSAHADSYRHEPDIAEKSWATASLILSEHDDNVAAFIKATGEKWHTKVSLDDQDFIGLQARLYSYYYRHSHIIKRFEHYAELQEVINDPRRRSRINKRTVPQPTKSQR